MKSEYDFSRMKSCKNPYAAKLDESVSGSAKLAAMGKVEQIEHQVSKLSRQELAHFRAWYSTFDADAWDRQLEQDVAAGKLDDLADKALQAHASGMTRAL